MIDTVFYEFEIQGYYSDGCGWETVTTEATMEEAREMLHCYDINEPQFPHRIRKHKITATAQKMGT